MPFAILKRAQYGTVQWHGSASADSNINQYMGDDDVAAAVLDSGLFGGA